MKFYFAYGANLSMRGMKHRCPNAKPLYTFVLKDWRLIFAGVASVMPSEGDYVLGGLWEITEECEHSLDLFEGYPYFYHKVVEQIDGKEVMFYRKNTETLEYPASSYLDIIQEGYKDWGLPLTHLYVKSLDPLENFVDKLREPSTITG